MEFLDRRKAACHHGRAMIECLGLLKGLQGGGAPGPHGRAVGS
jgi:hypothetical protein